MSCAISVVVPVFNEERDIGRLLRQLMDQQSPVGGFEILVADGGSTDRTRQIVQEFTGRAPTVMLLENKGRRSSAGRNVGARSAEGMYVLFLDGHCEVPRQDYLVRVLQIFETTGADCLCRPQYLTELADHEWSTAIAAARHSWLGHNPGSDIYGGEPGFTDPMSAGAAYKKSCLVLLGGYDERFDACEDVEFNRRVAKAGFRSYRHPDLVVNYRPRSSPLGLFKQMVRYGRGRARLWARHPTAVPWVLGGATVALCFGWVPAWILRLETGLLWYATVVAAWVAIAVLESVRIAGASGRAARTFLALMIIPTGLLIGFWRGIPDCPRFRRPFQAGGSPLAGMQSGVPGAVSPS